MTSTTTTPALHPAFLEQARHLVQGGELLPGGLEALAKKLQKAADTQTPLRIKLGLDPTRPDLHLGHTVVLRKLRAFQDLGHTAVLLIGDATAMIGDPSGRNQTRPPLTEEEILENAETYLTQAGKVIDVHKAEIVRNNDWFKSFGLKDFLQLAAEVTVAQIMARDDFNKRYTEQTPIALHELYYPLMQGYDSVMVRADVELGGTDQRFNNLMGRELQQAWNRKNADKITAKEEQPMPLQLVLLMPLLEGTDGVVKMSKSYPEHCINITDAPNNMYGKLMSVPDKLLLRYEALLTPLLEEQLKQHEEMLKKPVEEGGLHPRDLKAGLARWLVAQYHGTEASEAAEAAFVNQFKNKQLPDEMPEVTLKAGETFLLVELMAQHDLAPSKTEAKRLIAGGGVKLNGETKVTSEEATLTGTAGDTMVLQVGKRRFVRFLFEG